MNPYGFREENTLDLVLKSTQISNVFPLYRKHQTSVSIAIMPARRHFFRSSSPELPILQQTTIAISTHTRLSIRPTRPGPHPVPLDQRPHFEPAGGRRMIGGINDITVTEIFRSYQHEFRTENPNVIGDDDHKTFRRCSYT